MTTVRSERAEYSSNRARVLRIAAELFARNGYHGTGMAELERAVGLGRGALYHYIGSKETVLYDISRTQVDVMCAKAEARLAENLAPEDLLRAMAHDLLRNIAEHQAEWAVFFRDYTALTGERRDQVIAARERYESYWRQALDRGNIAGALQPTSPLLVKGILGMLNYTYLWFEPRGALTPEQIADMFLDALLGGIRARREATSR